MCEMISLSIIRLAVALKRYLPLIWCVIYLIYFILATTGK